MPSTIWLPSASRTTTQTSLDLEVGNYTAIVVEVVVTVIGTGSITLTINGKDLASNTYRLLLSGAAVVGNTTTVYTVSRQVAAVANVSAVAILPEFIQLVMTANNANAVTYSVGYDFEI